MSEAERIAFVIEQRGFDKALLWAEMVYKIYRRAVLDKRHFASKPYYRRKVIDSYLELKRWFMTNKAMNNARGER